MQLAMIGLGRMGGNMTERLMRDGHKVVVFDRSAEAIQKYVAMGSVGGIDGRGGFEARGSARGVDHGARGEAC